MKTLHFILTFCACLFLETGISLADPAKAAIVINNPTAKTVRYQFKWGADAPWKDMVLKPGFQTEHTKKYNPMGVPPLYVLFEQFGTIDGGANKQYKLLMGWDNNPRRYHFNVTKDRLDLFKN